MDGEAQVTSSEPANTPATVVDGAVESQTNDSHETNQSQEHASYKQKPEGFDPIDLKTATPEQIEARLNRLYGNGKRYEAKAREMERMNVELVQRLANLETSTSQIVNHIHTSDFKDSEARLSAERQAAWNKGDIDAFNKANDGILEIKAKKIVNESMPRPTPAEQPKPNGYMNGQRMPVQDVVNTAVERGEIDPQDANIYKSWESQADESGMKLRPWTDPNHPLNKAAAVEGRAVFENPAFQNSTFAQKLQEIDRRMRLQTPTSQNNAVLGSGNLTRGVRQPKVELSPQIERMAIRTKFGGSKAKSDADHVEAYRQAMIRSQAKGGRK